MTSYIAIDIGTHCGWARFDSALAEPLKPPVRPGGRVTSGAWDFKPTRFDSPHVRYSRFGQKLESELALGVDKVFYEKVMRHKGTAAAHVYGAFLNKLHETCAAFDIPFEGLSVQEIKKHATGKGNAGKDLMVSACQRWGFRPTSEDEADAICILRCAMEKKL